MKILMLTPYLPYPPASGGQIRTLNLLTYLKKNHKITVVSLYKNESEKKYASHLKEYCDEIYLCKRAEKPWQIQNILRSIFSFLPFLIVRNYSEEAHATIQHLLRTESFDVIHAETFYIMPHIPLTKIPILLVEQTIEFKVYQHFLSTLHKLIQMVLSLDILKLRYWEKFYWEKASLVAAVSKSDKDIIRSIASHIKPVIIPNGAGDEMFVSRLPQKNLKKPVLLFMGNFFWLQNTEAAQYLIEELFPQLREIIPGIQLEVAGQNATQKLKTKIKGISITNIKPDDTEMVKKLYRTATVFLAPIIGPGGTRLKVLAAMASGTPLVSTKTGVEGLQVQHGTHVMVANTTEEFLREVQALLSNETLYYTLQQNAYRLAKEKYSWSSIAKRLEKVYADIISG